MSPVLLTTHIKRFSVSRLQNFFLSKTLTHFFFELLKLCYSIGFFIVAKNCLTNLVLSCYSDNLRKNLGLGLRLGLGPNLGFPRSGLTQGSLEMPLTGRQGPGQWLSVILILSGQNCTLSFTVYSVHCTLYSVQYTVSTVHSIVYSIQ